jgi:probable HAF family extracellular repeat protein
MKRVFILLLVIIFSAVLMQGCSGNSGGGSSGDTGTSPAAAAPPEPPPPVIADVGDLIDLGDLVYPSGDHWYFTWARGINDEGTVIGQSNNGSPVRAAFKWEPGSEIMTFLGKHDGNYCDFYGQFVFFPTCVTPLIYSEAVDINSSESIIGNSSTGAGFPNYTEKRAFLWENDNFMDLPPIPGDYRKDQGDNPICEINSFSEAVDMNNKGEIVLTLDDNLILLGRRHIY